MKAPNRILLVVCAALGLALTGCNNLVLRNVVVGLRDGAANAASGIVADFFNKQFKLETDPTAGGDDDNVHM